VSPTFSRLSHYELLEPIGRDGATEIFRARDLRLDREVAVKLLRPDEMARPGAVERFRREARLASLVSHPHICAVHDSGEHEGQPFLVCELLEGRALDEVLAEAPLPPDRVLDIAIQLTDALVAAHRRGLVHGNLKPSNVFITTDGHVKLLELGAASAAPEPPGADHLTSGDAPTASFDGSATTSVAASPPEAVRLEDLFHAYLSPEQVAGGPVDGRADLFATGTLLYEMTTGGRPFAGETPGQIASAIVRREPARPEGVYPRLVLAIEPIVMRALAKDPSRRYQTGAELLEDLRRARRTIELPDRPPGRWRAAGRPAAVAAATLGGLLVLGALTGVPASWWRNAPPDPVERNTILVSQIVNGTGDPDFDGTLREAVSVYLAQSPHLDVVSDERIRGTLQRMGRESDARMTHDVASEVCQRLGLQAMLEGSVSTVGRETVVALVATDCHSGATIARQQVGVDRKEDVLRAIGPLTEAVRTSLGESSASLARHNVPIEEATTPSLEALKAYTEGAARRAAGAEIEAIPFFEQAIALDARFALAHATLSTIYGGLGETGRSEEFARRAYEHREHVSERERLFITYQYHDRFTGDQLRARETLDVWKRTYPRDYRPANALAVLLNRLGEYEAAAAEAEEAIRRNPAHAFPYSNLAYAHRGAGRYAEARAVADEAVARGIETVPMRRLLYQLAELDGDESAARAQIAWAEANRRGFDVTGARAQVLAARGRVAEGRALYRQTVEAAAGEGFAQIASGYAAQEALTDALFGYPAEAIEQARRVVRAPAPYEPQLRAATALALAGSSAEAESVVRRLRRVRPDDTLLHTAYLPAAEAAILLGRGQATEAIDELRRAPRYETGTVAALIPIYLRGEARRRAGDAAGAAREFQAVLNHQGADPFSPVIPLAQLGLARALGAAGDTAGSRGAYEKLLAGWAAADPDLPALRAAHEELAGSGR
jgi:eukaryotic-like serine/threonine-protein kinase